MEPCNFGNYDKELIEAVSAGNATETENILIKYLFETYLKICGIGSDDSSNLKALVNCTDELGRTPLQIAVSSGFEEICELLLENWADINKEKEMCRRPLALAIEHRQSHIVPLLLKYRLLYSEDYVAENKATSLGLEECRGLINDPLLINVMLDRYRNSKSDETSQFYVLLKSSLYKLLLNENKYPVKLILFLKENIAVVENLENFIYGLNYLSTNLKFKGHEWSSWVCHNIACVFKEAKRFLSPLRTEIEACSVSNYNVLDSLIKSWLKYQPLNGHSQVLLNLIAESISTYPFKKTKVYNVVKSVISESFNKECLSEICKTCRNRLPRRNGRSKAANYCNQTCQKLHWSVLEALVMAQ